MKTPRARGAVVVLHGKDRPPGLAPVAEAAEVRYAESPEELRAALPGAEVLFVA